MAGRADLTDGDIKQHLNDVKAGKITWFLIGHVPKSDVKFKVTAEGNGDIEELKGELNDGKVQFGFIAVDLSGIKKFVFISWCGEGVTGMKKGFFNGQSQDVAAFFTGFHVQINARNEDDINSNDLLSRVKKATGASFYKQHKAQDAENNPEPSNIKYEQPNLNQSTENNPQASKIRYEQPNHNQSTENNPQPSKIRYEQFNVNQSTENNPAPSRTPGRVNAPPAKVPPPVSNVPPAKPPPTPKPAPPVQEERYQELAQEEEYQEEEHGEEEEYQEEATGEASYGTCKAVYAYQGEKEGDLSFNEGDIISILDESDPSGWWEGELNGVRGYFPSNFVEKC